MINSPQSVPLFHPQHTLALVYSNTLNLCPSIAFSFTSLRQRAKTHYNGVMKLILMGTGTSHGIPVIGCDCAVCHSSDTRDIRFRCSAFLESQNLLVDVGPEFRLQALKYHIKRLDAVFITHSHADHLHGIDDLRIFSHTKALDPSHPDNRESEGPGLAIYTTTAAWRDIEHRFDYIFTPMKEGGGKPKIRILSGETFSPKNPFVLNGVEVIPVMMKHGSLDDMGLLFSETVGTHKKSIAYLTDCNYISDEAIDTVRGAAGDLVHLVIDGLRVEPHSTHFSFDQALEAAERMEPQNVYLTHITHNMSHVQIQEYVDSVLPRFPLLQQAKKRGGYVGPAFDGQVLECQH